jgi:hypothetical protein
VTPKTNRQKGTARVRSARMMRLINVVTLLLLGGTYLSAYSQGSGTTALALMTVYALLWLPSMVIAAVKS